LVWAPILAGLVNFCRRPRYGGGNKIAHSPARSPGRVHRHHSDYAATAAGGPDSEWASSDVGPVVRTRLLPAIQCLPDGVVRVPAQDLQQDTPATSPDSEGSPPPPQ
jgi:hypothetical protein